MASNLTGCATSADYAAVCVDPDTQERVEDDQCDDDSDYNGAGTGFFWYYLAARAVVPAVGQTDLRRHVPRQHPQRHRAARRPAHHRRLDGEVEHHQGRLRRQQSRLRLTEPAPAPPALPHHVAVRPGDP